MTPSMVTKAPTTSFRMCGVSLDCERLTALYALSLAYTRSVWFFWHGLPSQTERVQSLIAAERGRNAAVRRGWDCQPLALAFRCVLYAVERLEIGILSPES